MSDHEHDDHGGGAHEVDNMPSRKLFNLLFGLSGLTLIACIGVVQLFNRQVDSIQGTRHSKVSFQLAEYQAEMDELKGKWNVVIIKDDDGVSKDKGGKGLHEARRYTMPLAEAAKRVREEPDKYLKAPRPYRGWQNPDPKAPKPTARPARPTRPGVPRPGAVAPGRPGAAPGAAPARPGVAPAPGAAPARPGAAPAQPNEGAKPAAPKGDEGKAPKPATPKGDEGKAPPKPPKGDEGKAPPKPPKGDEGKAPPKPATPKGDEGKAPN